MKFSAKLVNFDEKRLIFHLKKLNIITVMILSAIINRNEILYATSRVSVQNRSDPRSSPSRCFFHWDDIPIALHICHVVCEDDIRQAGIRFLVELSELHRFSLWVILFYCIWSRPVFFCFLIGERVTPGMYANNFFIKDKALLSSTFKIYSVMANCFL